MEITLHTWEPMELKYSKTLTLGTYKVVVNFNTLGNGNLDIWFKIRV